MPRACECTCCELDDAKHPIRYRHRIVRLCLSGGGSICFGHNFAHVCGQEDRTPDTSQIGVQGIGIWRSGMLEPEPSNRTINNNYGPKRPSTNIPQISQTDFRHRAFWRRVEGLGFSGFGVFGPAAARAASPCWSSARALHQ